MRLLSLLETYNFHMKITAFSFPSFLRVACTLFFVTWLHFSGHSQEFAPSEFPDRVTLTWSADPATSQTVTWRTAGPVKNVVAQIRLEDSTPHTDKAFKEYGAESRTLEVGAGRTDAYHHVVFRDLKPATIYIYRVGDGENWSEWFQFRTADAAGSTADFSFIYLGDGQNDLKSRWSRAIRQAFRHQPDARFIIHTGDLINRGNTDREWGEWHYASSFIHSMIPIIPAPGNHEFYRNEKEESVLDPHWEAQFTLPKNGPEGHQDAVFYTDYQNLRIITLNSQLIVRDEASREVQAQWLEKVLQENRQKWTVVMFHHPVYSTAKNRDNEALRERLKPLFDQYGVDLVLQGHDHTYARGKGPDAPVNGPVYLVSVSGPKMYASDSDRWMEVALTQTQLYQVIHVSEHEMALKTYKLTGELFDSFKLVK